MPRKPRITIQSGFYHILSQGNNRQTVFHTPADYLQYLSQLLLSKKKWKIRIFHYCLLPNHVHLILAAQNGRKLSRFMHKVNLSYALYHRRTYGGSGHFWQDRFKSFIIPEVSDLLECARAIELSPVKLHLAGKPESYRWSSYSHYGLDRFDEILSLNPAYKLLARHESVKKLKYRVFIREGLKERRSLTRYFQMGIFKKYGNQSTYSNGQIRHARWGRPRKHTI